MQKIPKKDVMIVGTKVPAVSKFKLPQKELRMDIGVRNPYALANAALKEKIGWKDLAHDKRDEVFRRAFKKSLKDLFDPDQKSLSPVYACSAASPCPAIGWANLASWLYHDKFHGSDPVQGAACDCYLIAALSSVAWTCQRGVITKDEATNPGYYTVKFYDDMANVTATIGVSKNLPVISNNLVYADSSTANETWPSYYEKAYAQLYANLGSNPTTTQLIDTLTQATLNCLCNGGNPLASLYHITKPSPYNYTTKTTKYPATDYSDASAMWTAINNLTSGNKTIYPAVAWTYPDKEHAAQSLQMTTDAWNWADYAGTTIVAQHAYSIFGTFNDTAAGKKYIILRNPFGSDQPDPSIPQLYTGSWSYTNKFYKANGVWNQTIMEPTPQTINLGNRDGIFALEAEAFRAYFEAFGWVK